MDAYDLVIIGAGAAGSTAAFSIGKQGGRMAIVERDHLGGTCTNEGCVPTKALLKAARIAQTVRDAGRYGIRSSDPTIDWPAIVERSQKLIKYMLRDGERPFEEQGITVYRRAARFRSAHELELDGLRITARRIVIATGAKPAIPPIPGLEELGYVTNEGAIMLPRLPGHLAILGGGAIGVEFAQMFIRFGCRITLIEGADRILGSEDAEISSKAAEYLGRQGIRIESGARVIKAEGRAGKKRLSIEQQGRESTVEADEILVATGRRPDVEDLNLAAAGVEVNEKGWIVVDEHLGTSVPHIMACGDVHGRLLFTHVASYEADLVAASIVEGKPKTPEYRAIPRVTFSDPEVASVGLTEAQARSAGHEVKIGRADLADSEKAVIDGEMDGFIKVIGDARSGELLGGHIIAPDAGNLVAELVAAMAVGAHGHQVGEAIHPYPTNSEAVAGALRQLEHRHVPRDSPMRAVRE